MTDKQVLSLEEVLGAIAKGEKGPFALASSAESMTAIMEAVTDESVTMTTNKEDGTLIVTIGKVATESLKAPESKPQGCFRVKE